MLKLNLKRKFKLKLMLKLTLKRKFKLKLMLKLMKMNLAFFATARTAYLNLIVIVKYFNTIQFFLSKKKKIRNNSFSYISQIR